MEYRVKIVEFRVKIVEDRVKIVIWATLTYFSGASDFLLYLHYFLMDLLKTLDIIFNSPCRKT